MKNYTQVYVKNSMEAARTYCKAFGAEITLEMKTEGNFGYALDSVIKGQWKNRNF